MFPQSENYVLVYLAWVLCPNSLLYFENSGLAFVHFKNQDLVRLFGAYGFHNVFVA